MIGCNKAGDVLSILQKINLLFLFSIIVYNILMNILFLKPVSFIVEENVHVLIIVMINIIVIKKIKRRFKDDSVH